MIKMLKSLGAGKDYRVIFSQDIMSMIKACVITSDMVEEEQNGFSLCQTTP